MSKTIVAYVPDLLDRSKVAAAAPGRVTFVSNPADLLGFEADLAVFDLARLSNVDVIGSIDVPVIGRVYEYRGHFAYRIEEVP